MTRVLSLLLALLSVVSAFAGNNTMVGAATAVSAGEKIRATTYNDNFSRIYAEVRGNIGTLNMLDDAVTTAKLASTSVTLAKVNAEVSVFLVPSGTVLDYFGTSAPTGWVLASGRTIGDASSGGTERANADTLVLFTLLWNSMTNTEAPVSSGRGASASADFNAHKTITLPDLRGKVVAGLDFNNGAGLASKITAATNFDGSVNGRSGGSQNHSLTSGENGTHNHTATDSGHAHTGSVSSHSHVYDKPTTHSGANTVAAGTTYDALLFAYSATDSAVTVPTVTINSGNASISVANSGSGTAHTILQPTMTLSKIIKLYYPADWAGDF